MSATDHRPEAHHRPEADHRPEAHHRPEVLTDALVAMADTLAADFDLAAFLHVLVDRAVLLFAVDSAGLLMPDGRGGLGVRASSGEAARVLELAQVQLDQGPCVDAVRGAVPVHVDDLADGGQAWPDWTPVARAAGVRAVYATPMRLREETIGALGLFATVPGAVSATDLRAVQALADIATIGILQERAVQSRGVLAEQLQTALRTRVVLEQAKGVITGRSDLDPEQAFTALRAYCRDTNAKLGATALAVVSGALAVSLVLDGRR